MISAKLDGRLELSRQLGAARKVIVRDGFLVRGRPVPYHVPTHAQTAAKRGVLSWLRGWALARQTRRRSSDSNRRSPP